MDVEMDQVEAARGAGAAWQGRFEVLAALLVAGAAVLPVSVAAGWWATGGLDGGPSLLDALRAGAQAVGPLDGGLLVLAFLLVVEGPGDELTGRGRTVLGAVAVVGAVLAVAGAGAVVDLLVHEGGRLGSATGGSVWSRVAGALPVAAGVALCGVVAWLAWSLVASTPTTPPDPAT